MINKTIKINAERKICLLNDKIIQFLTIKKSGVICILIQFSEK